MLDSSLSFADCVCLDLSRLSDSLALKAKNPAKLQNFLEKIRSTLYKVLALRASYEYEFIQGFRFSEKSVSQKIRPISPVIGKGKAAVLLRIREDFEDEFLSNVLLTVKKVGVVDAIIVDRDVLNSEENNCKIGFSFENGYDNSISENKSIDERDNNQKKDLGFGKVKEVEKESILYQRLGKIRNILGDDFPIISCGGVNTGSDVFFRLKSGADFVLVDSAFTKRGPYCLEKIVKELEQVMEAQNINSIREIRANKV